jgi:hypothetical protein
MRMHLLDVLLSIASIASGVVLGMHACMMEILNDIDA